MRTKVLITVKAYPAISNKYGETVCTAGITEEGKWIRIYPIPFRKLDYNNQFKKYDWIELDLIRNKSDFRIESYRPLDLSTMKTIGRIDSDSNSWIERRASVINKGPKIYTNLAELISEAQNKATCVSLATFKPKNTKDFIFKPVSGEWDPKKLKKLEAKDAQGRLFDDEIENDIQNFELVAKLPYKFSFVFEDDSNKESTMMIEDWETGMLYWNSLKRYNGNENLACEDVKKKYFDDFAKTKDYYFFLGTTQLHHYTARNPFVIIGDFRPKHILQDSLF
jgi:hypothetical protein